MERAECSKGFSTLPFVAEIYGCEDFTSLLTQCLGGGIPQWKRNPLTSPGGLGPWRSSKNTVKQMQEGSR